MSRKNRQAISEFIMTSLELESVKLAYVDFWPSCLHAEEGFTNVHFERFDILLPRANNWLRHHASADVIRCETLEKRVTSPEQLLTDSNESNGTGSAHKKIYLVKGLRLWYCVNSSRHPERLHPVQIGYRNFIPRCREEEEEQQKVGGSVFIFDDLSMTYENVNEQLIENPLEGKILTIETVSLHLSQFEWNGKEIIHAEQSMWPFSNEYHILYITRIFYLFECPAYELIGASDFLPDILEDHRPESHVNECQRSSCYSTFASAMVKVNSWLEKVKDIRIVNIQTLMALDPVPLSDADCDKINTGSNYILRVDNISSLVRFIRVTYVRPKFGLPPGGLSSPKAVIYRTFVPQKDGHNQNSSDLIGSADISSTTRCELETEMWKRVLNWINKTNDKTLIGIEIFSYPSTLINTKDDGETMTVPINSSNKSQMLQLQYNPSINCIRIFYDAQRISDNNSCILAKQLESSSQHKNNFSEQKSSNCSVS